MVLLRSTYNNTQCHYLNRQLYHVRLQLQQLAVLLPGLAVSLYQWRRELEYNKIAITVYLIAMSSRRPIHTGDSQSSEVEGYIQDSPVDRPNSAQLSYNSEEVSDSDDQSTGIPHQRRKQSQIPEPKCSPKRMQNSPKHSAHTYVAESSHHKNIKTNATYYFTFPLILIAALIVIYSFYAHSSEKEESKRCSFQRLQKLFPEQDEKLWRYLIVGIENILEKSVETPAVYLFVHEGGQNIKELVREIASHSSSCFGQNMRHAEMDINDFNSEETLNDYGYAIESFKRKIKTGKVILIANLNEIPANAARALHAICDTVSPIASDIVIFLTLTVKNIVTGYIEIITEDALKQLWGPHLKYNELDPLITRVTDQVIALKSSNN